MFHGFPSNQQTGGPESGDLPQMGARRAAQTRAKWSPYFTTPRRSSPSCIWSSTISSRTTGHPRRCTLRCISGMVRSTRLSCHKNVAYRSNARRHYAAALQKFRKRHMLSWETVQILPPFPTNARVFELHAGCRGHSFREDPVSQQELGIGMRQHHMWRYQLSKHR